MHMYYTQLVPVIVTVAILLIAVPQVPNDKSSIVMQKKGHLQVLSSNSSSRGHRDGFGLFCTGKASSGNHG